MKAKLKEEIDADLLENRAAMTRHKTSGNPHPVYCGICSETYYTDRETGERFSNLVEAGVDNPFVCDECTAAYHDQAGE